LVKIFSPCGASRASSARRSCRIIGLRKRPQHRLEQLPAAGYRFYLDPLSRRMRATNVWAEGDHVQMRMTGREQAALQSGVDHLDGCGLAELGGVDLLAQGKKI